ncbi:MAG: hypothetical protein HQL09_09345 [Nitrospirae bacterium]|nr:hypothetical protein [Nitrospirota bacterium]
MNPAQILSILSGLAAVVWSVLTWSEEQHKQRQLKRDQEAALFVNPFLRTIEELQTRLYGILEEDELNFYRQEYPDRHEFGSPAAIEILYHLSQYFGWQHRTYRYGPYTKDPTVIELARQIGETFENRKQFPGDAFRFTVNERASLGEVVVRHIGDINAILPVFNSIPLFQFEEELSNEQSRHAVLFRSKAVRDTLSAIDNADKADNLEGRQRLAVLQNLLVDLQSYLETAEGFSVSIGGLKKAKVEGICFRSFLRQCDIARILHQTPGRIRLGITRLKTDSAYADRLQSLLGSIENIRSFRINTAAASLTVCYNPDIPGTEFATRIMKTVEDGSRV